MKTFRKVSRASAVVSRCKMFRSAYGVHVTGEGRSVSFLLDLSRFGTFDPSTKEIRVDHGHTEMWKLKNGDPLIIDYDPRTFRLIAWATSTA
jgi:hypothetical protein